jgi:hypothetical protein
MSFPYLPPSNNTTLSTFNPDYFSYASKNINVDDTQTLINTSINKIPNVSKLTYLDINSSLTSQLAGKLSTFTSTNTNAYLGYLALNQNTTGYYNAGIGFLSLPSNTTGYMNSALGTNSGVSCLTSNKCTFIGSNSCQDISTNTYTNSTALGYFSTISESNQIVIGNNAIDKLAIGGSRIAIGNTSRTGQGAGAISIGLYAGQGAGQGVNSVAIGQAAGFGIQGSYAVALGNGAGQGNQPSQSIMINASSSNLTGTNSGLYINPVRSTTSNSSTAYSMFYDSSTKEITYNTVNTFPKYDKFTFALNIVTAGTIALGVLTNVTNSGILNVLSTYSNTTFSFYKTGLHEIILTYQITSLSGGSNSSYSLLFTVLNTDDTNVGHIHNVSGSSYMQGMAISTMYQDTSFNGNNAVIYSNQPVLSKGTGVYTNSCSFRFLVPVLSTSDTYKIAAVCNQVCNLTATYCVVNYLG